LYWGLGIGDWGLGPIPNPQSPIPKLLSHIITITIFSNNIYIILINSNNYIESN